MQENTYWAILWKRFRKQRLGYAAFYVVLLFCLVGVYAPFLASSKPLFVSYNHEMFFPLFRYLFFSGFYTKRLDIFFNLLMITLPLIAIAFKWLKGKTRLMIVSCLFIGQFAAFLLLILFPIHDPSSNLSLAKERQQTLYEPLEAGISSIKQPNWQFDLRYMNSYAKLNLLLTYKQRKEQQKALLPYLKKYTEITQAKTLPTLWQIEQSNESQKIARLEAIPKNSPQYASAQNDLAYIHERQQWLENQSQQLHFEVMPLISHFHWEDDAGGQQALNQVLPWWDLTRINRKDLLSALIFGVRISLVVGITSVALALLIGIPVGSFAGYYGGTFDIIVSRLLEIWEAMPTFFMLLMVVAILQSKSIFLVIAIIGLFGWTGFSRYIRGEFFKQRNLPYVAACHALGFDNAYIMFRHILPNAIPPVLTLLPFAVMGAITSEAGLSFLGLGEEGSCSWGVLMDEGRTAFPQESYLLWPPAILLTILLIAIAMVGDRLRDALDPKLHR